MNADKIKAIMQAASSTYSSNDSEASRQKRYDTALRALKNTLQLPLTVDDATDILNRLINEIWLTKPLGIVVDGDGELPDSVECAEWRHGYAQGHVLQRSEDFGHEVLSDLLDLIGKEAEINYDDCGWYIEGIYNL